MKNTKEYDNQWYAKNKERIRDKKLADATKRRHRNRQYIVDYLKSHPCIDCGEEDYVVLEFDHQHSKQYTIANMITVGLEKIKNEIEKCEVVCANCHRRRTAKQLGWYKGINENGL